jgi:MFS transporter, ACS family, hexuronate transporter
MVQFVLLPKMPKIRHLRWWIASLLLLATIINYVDRQTLSVLAPVLRDQFRMTNTDYSHVVFAFLLAYTFMQSGSGRIMDWLGTRRGMGLTIAWWSVAAMLHAFAGSVLQFGIFRFLLGLGEAGNWPGGVKTVSEWFPPKERAFAIGLFNSGSCVGALVAPPLVVWIALHFGWRAAFLMTGAAGFGWMTLWLLFYRAPKEHPWITAEELAHIEEHGSVEIQPQNGRVRWRSLFGYKQVWGLVLARMLCEPVWWFYVFWLPEYLKRERHFGLEMIGLFAWIPFLTADLGNFAGGGLSSWLLRRGWPVLRARKFAMVLSAATMLAGVPAVLTDSPALAVALISLTTFAYSGWAANILTLPADLFPRNVVASVSGIGGTGAGVGGMIFTLLTGIIVDRFSYTPVFIAAGFMPLAGAAFLFWGVRKPLEAADPAPGIVSSLK